MNSRLHFRFLTGLMLCLLVTGCASSPKHGTIPPADSSNKPPSATTHPDGMDAASENPVDIIARRTQAYSRSMEPMLSQRAVPQSQPSIVQWADPNELRLSNMPPVEPKASAPRPPQIVPLPVPAAVESSASTANEPLNVAQTASAPAKPEPVLASQTLPPAPVARAVPQDTVDVTSAKFARRVREYPHDVSGQLDYQLLQFLLDQPVPDLNTMSTMPGEDRELVAAVVDGLSNFRNNLRADSNMLLSRKVKPLLEMADRLRAQADLTIPTVVLCTSVKGFGNYEPWQGDPPRFSAGAEHPVILYCEVQNFSSQLDTNKLWQTQLTQDAVLYTENGMAVWNDTTQAVKDASRNRRQDFFVVQKLKLPNTLQIGRYLLKVSIEDKQAKRVAEATLPLLVVAQ